MADVTFDRAHREMQPRGDRLVGEAVGHEPEHLQLAGAQAGGSRRTRPGVTECVRDRLVEPEPRPLGPDPVGVGAEGGLAPGPDPPHSLAEEAGEVAVDADANAHRRCGHPQRDGWVTAPDETGLADQRVRQQIGIAVMLEA